MGWVYDLLGDPARVSTLRGQWLAHVPPAPLKQATYATLTVGPPVALHDLVTTRPAPEWKRVGLAGLIAMPPDRTAVYQGVAIIDPAGIPLAVIGFDEPLKAFPHPDGLRFHLSVQAGN